MIRQSGSPLENIGTETLRRLVATLEKLNIHVEDVYVNLLEQGPLAPPRPINLAEHPEEVAQFQIQIEGQLHNAGLVWRKLRGGLKTPTDRVKAFLQEIYPELTDAEFDAWLLRRPAVADAAARDLAALIEG